MISTLLSSLGNALATFLSKERDNYVSLVEPEQMAALRSQLEPGDVILVEGRTRFSVGIKYLTQSTWSHAAVYVGPATSPVLADSAARYPGNDGQNNCLIEADVVNGVIKLPLNAYDGHNIRICRAKGVTADQRKAVCDYLESRIGDQYDLKNVFDLARWLLPTPPVPTKLRRRLLSFGSGSPTTAICSTLIAQAFQSIQYPILPIIEQQTLADCFGNNCAREILRIRHHSLFVPRDFDLSPYFEIVKPRITGQFDPSRLVWATPASEAESSSATAVERDAEHDKPAPPIQSLTNR